MQKFAAVLCVVALMLTLAVPALANPSISDVAVEAEAKTESVLPEDTKLEVAEADAESIDDEDVQEVVELVNSTEEAATVQAVVEKLAEKLPEGTKIEDGVVTIAAKEEGEEDKEIDLKDYHFVTPFAQVALVDKEGEASFEEDVKPTITFDQNSVDAENLDDYLVMLIDPTTGEVYFIALEQNEAGEITAELPCLGIFALIQKPAEA